MKYTTQNGLLSAQMQFNKPDSKAGSFNGSYCYVISAVQELH
jgi:hypothetical protein